jgi:aspartokinase-like uncharacterized kinase
MWVIKIGGHLADDPLLRQWLDQIANLGSGRVVLVPGGGDFARHALSLRDTWRLDGHAAHNVAMLGMGQFAFVLQALQPDFSLCVREEDIMRTLHGGGIAVWTPLGQLRRADQDDLPPAQSADGLALWLAERLNAEELVLVKSSPLPVLDDWAALVEAGIVEPHFARAARGADMPVTLLERDNPGALQEMLIGHGCAARHRPHGQAL